jgi:hypothetical protein
MTPLPGQVTLGPGINHPVAVDGEVVIVLLLVLLVGRHPVHERQFDLETRFLVPPHLKEGNTVRRLTTYELKPLPAGSDADPSRFFRIRIRPDR